MIIESLGIKEPHEDAYTMKHGRANKIYPSVTCGPIDISRAKEKLAFAPSSLVSDCLVLIPIESSHSRDRHVLHAHCICQLRHFATLSTGMEGDVEGPETQRLARQSERLSRRQADTTKTGTWRELLLLIFLVFIGGR